MNFMFEWQEQYFTSERSEQVGNCSCHENIKFISSSERPRTFSENFQKLPKMSEDCRRLSRKTRRYFDDNQLF